MPKYLKYILLLFVVLRIITLLSAWYGITHITFKSSFPYADAILEPYGNPLFWVWGNFDGVHYLMLAKDGYNFGLTQAFFPGYMLFISGLGKLMHNYLLSALLISHLAFIGSLIMFYKLLRFDYNRKISYWALAFYALFPTSFYFLGVYTESLFLLLLFSAFYLIRKNKLWQASIIGIGLTATRLVGIFIIPAFLLEVWQNILIKSDSKLSIISKLKQHKSIIYTVIPVAGLLMYMAYLSVYHDDPLLFAHVQSKFGAGRDTTHFILIYQVIWRYIKMFITVDRSNPLYYTLIAEFIFSIGAFTLLIWGWIQKIKPSYLLFSFLALILPTLTGTFSSMPRYVIVAFPIFIVLAQIKSKWTKITILSIFIVLLIIFTIMFTRGYWIS